jgi:hypothetical protein
MLTLSIGQSLRRNNDDGELAVQLECWRFAHLRLISLILKNSIMDP